MRPGSVKFSILLLLSFGLFLAVTSWIQEDGAASNMKKEAWLGHDCHADIYRLREKLEQQFKV